ncbi:UNVERIFIED_CONTAM: hypothetical protein K2H54_045153 [Gekko kuhli]
MSTFQHHEDDHVESVFSAKGKMVNHMSLGNQQNPVCCGTGCLNKVNVKFYLTLEKKQNIYLKFSIEVIEESGFST